MSEALREVGSMLKAKREEMNLSLKEAENATSIRMPYLEAIEGGQIQEFISGVYALGFMKQYAQFLGIDLDPVIQDHPAAFRMPEENHEFDYGIGTVEVRGSMGGGVRWLPNLLWALGVAAVLAAAWYFAKSLGVI